jgi:transcriptional regulator with XRE-family HTH domain
MKRKYNFWHPLAKARVKARYGNQIDFAKAADVSPTTIANLEAFNQARLPNGATIIKLAIALKVSPEEVIAMIEEGKAMSKHGQT